MNSLFSSEDFSSHSKAFTVLSVLSGREPMHREQIARRYCHLRGIPYNASELKRVSGILSHLGSSGYVAKVSCGVWQMI